MFMLKLLQKISFTLNAQIHVSYNDGFKIVVTACYLTVAERKKFLITKNIQNKYIFNYSTYFSKCVYILKY